MAAGAGGEAGLGADDARLEAVLGGDPHGAFVEGARRVVVPGEGGGAAEAAELVGGLGPQAEVLGDAQPLFVQPCGPRVVASHLGESGEGFDSEQLPPAVAEFGEESRALPPGALKGAEIAADMGLVGADAQGRGEAPPVVEGAESVEGEADQFLTGGLVAHAEQGEAEEPLGAGALAPVRDVLGEFDSAPVPLRAVGAVPDEDRESGLPGPRPGPGGAAAIVTTGSSSRTG